MFVSKAALSASSTVATTAVISSNASMGAISSSKIVYNWSNPCVDGKEFQNIDHSSVNSFTIHSGR